MGPFHTELDKVEFKTIVDGTFRLDDARIMDGFRTEYGEKDACLMKFTQANGDSFTTISSSGAVVDKIRKVLLKRALPVMVTIRKAVSETTNNEYYYVE